MSGVIDAFARKPHYVDHLAPIWHALPPKLRGVFYCGGATRATFMRAQAFGFRPLAENPPRGERVTLIAGGIDARPLKYRRLVLVEHGAGQTYHGDRHKDFDHVSYAGGPGRERVELFVCPRQEVVDKNLVTYPSARAVIASPRLETLKTIPRIAERDNVVVSRHWDLAHLPEMQSAWPHWKTTIAELGSNGRWSLALHAHPRVARQMRGDAKLMGAHFIATWEDVIAQAAVFVCDNSSALFEAAYLDVPVVVLDAPWYRHNVEHGLRFWSHADVGPRPASPGMLEQALADAIENGVDRELAASVYEHVDGSIARAVEATLELVA